MSTGWSWRRGRSRRLSIAPPRLFFVDTPGATAVDMGCVYEMDVAADGSGLLRVTGGWVELRREGAGGFAGVSRVPAGAVCRLGVGGEPGLPWFEDAGEGFGGLVEGAASGEAGGVGWGAGGGAGAGRVDAVAPGGAVGG
ncbi:MAG: hypothetical protein HND58_05105 [Planctomycetota bacterium]|nr:MAG: hypothetical protein HND58_05105 [Planctomycetota bacterium]